MNWGREVRRFLSFNAIGVVTTLVSLPLMATLDWMGVPYAAYTALNYLVGIGLGFWFNFRWAFADQSGRPMTALVRYLAVFFSLLILVQGLQAVLIETGGWPRWLGVGLGMVVYGVVGYGLCASWVFRSPERAKL